MASDTEGRTPRYLGNMPYHVGVVVGAMSFMALFLAATFPIYMENVDAFTYSMVMAVFGTAFVMVGVGFALNVAGSGSDYE